MNRNYGLMAMYDSLDGIKAALRRLRAADYTQMEVFTPFPDEEVDELIPGKPTCIGWVMLFAGLLGGAGAYFLQWYASRDYPINVGGRPINSWPSYIPVTFELTVLSAATAGVIALLWFAGLPRLDYPTFNDPRFLRASHDRFFICLHGEEVFRSPEHLRELLGPEATSIEEVLS